MFSKRSLEGEFLIDHRASPGIAPEDVPAGLDVPIVGPGELVEGPIYVCGHCSHAVLMNPDRERAREWCAKCDRYICDECSYRLKMTLQCNTVKRRIDQVAEELERGVSPLLLTKL